MKRHNLKVLPEYFEAQIAGLKPFEFRKHDREFRIGDEIKLNEVDSEGIGELKPTGRACLVRIKYILCSTHNAPFEGIEPGYSVLGTELVYAP